MQNKLVIIDGTALLFRMYFAKLTFTSTDGVEVGGGLGATQTVKKIIKTLKPKYVAAVFDAGSKTFRNDIASDYKANRGAPPEDLKPQFDLVYEAIAALGIRCFKRKGYEADDLMVSLAKQVNALGVAVQMVTDDKDVAQVVKDGEHPIQQVLFAKKLVWGEQEVRDKFGVRPDQLIDYLSMIGDSVDNIKGIAGVGPKSAAALLNQFGTLQEIYQQLESVADMKVRGAKSLQRKLEEGRADVHLAKKLIELKVDMDLGSEHLLEDLEYIGPSEQDISTYEKLGFTQPYRELKWWMTTSQL